MVGPLIQSIGLRPADETTLIADPPTDTEPGTDGFEFILDDRTSTQFQVVDPQGFSLDPSLTVDASKFSANLWLTNFHRQPTGITADASRVFQGYPVEDYVTTITYAVGTAFDDVNLIGNQSGS